MNIKLYNTKDSNNTINKKLEGEVSFEIAFKDTANVVSPIVKLTSDTPILYNYAYIEEFDRYYFVNNINIMPNKIYILSLECDVLESFKEDILNSYGVISRREDGNKYYDSGYSSEVRKEVDIYKSDRVVELIDNSILVTIK